MAKEKPKNYNSWAIIILVIVGAIFGIGPFRNAQCSKKETTYEQSLEMRQLKSSSTPTFTGSHRKYKCSGRNGKCLCTKYEKKSTFDSDCKNCGHHKKEHYEFM